MSGAARRQRLCAIQVDVVFWREKGEFFGHGLQFDIVSVGATPEVAEQEMQRLILAHVSYVEGNDNWDYLYRPAPAEVWQRFAHAARRARLPKWTRKPSVTAVEMVADNARVSTRFAFA